MPCPWACFVRGLRVDGMKFGGLICTIDIIQSRKFCITYRMTDRLAALLSHFAVRAHAFHAGGLCGIHELERDAQCGQLHLVRRGRLRAFHGGHEPLWVEAPSLLMYPRPLARHFVIGDPEGADLVCADLSFEGGPAHPVRAALPDVVALPLDRLLPDGLALIDLLFAEADAKRCGRQKVLDSLFDALLVHILRALMEAQVLQTGLLAGMADLRLRKALVAMHEAPSHMWSIDALANRAGMSRTAFANHFRAVVGSTPGHYLQTWRIGLAQKSLQRGHSLRQVADSVGYAGEAALSRAFKAQTGLSPRQWGHRQQTANGGDHRTGESMPGD